MPSKKIVKFEPEQEIELFVKMPPKAIRNIVVQISARDTCGHGGRRNVTEGRHEHCNSS